MTDVGLLKVPRSFPLNLHSTTTRPNHPHHRASSTHVATHQLRGTPIAPSISPALIAASHRHYALLADRATVSQTRTMADEATTPATTEPTTSTEIPTRPADAAAEPAVAGAKPAEGDAVIATEGVAEGKRQRAWLPWCLLTRRRVSFRREEDRRSHYRERGDYCRREARHSRSRQ